MLGYCAYVWIDAWRFDRAANQQLEQAIRNAPPAPVSPSEPVAPPKTLPGDSTAPDPTPVSSDLIGRMDIERIGVSVIVMEGTGDAVLRRAVGHIGGTALPGHPGNVGLAGHRDTFFRPLRNIKRDDLITLTTPGGDYKYRVVSTKIVDPHDVGVLKASDSEVLTLVTCYPFYFLGSAPSRFIVRAERVLTETPSSL